jgi:peptidyl-prolyl cis-trans isomerase B (cyclophilin B)
VDVAGGRQVTPKGRERAYEKRRYEQWQARLAAKRARRRAIRRNVLIGAAGVLTVAIIVGAFTLFTGGDDKGTPAATPSAQANNPCPVPTAKAPAKPKRFAKAPPASDAGGKAWKLTLKTTCGVVTAELDGAKAPKAVAATLLLARSGFYDNSPCHRLTTAATGISVLQCGDPTGTGTGGPGFQYGPVENVPKDYTYPAGTIAMARGSSPDSQGSQFFIVYADSTIGSKAAGGYTVLGRITSGLDVVKKVAAGGVSDASGDGKPLRAVSITSTSVAAG